MKNIRLKLARVEKELEKWSNNKQFSSCSAIFLKNKKFTKFLAKSKGLCYNIKSVGFKLIP